MSTNHTLNDKTNKIQEVCDKAWCPWRFLPPEIVATHIGLFPQPWQATRLPPDPSFGRSSFKGQMCLPGYKIVEHTRYMLKVEILLSGGEEKQVDMCMAMNTTKETKLHILKNYPKLKITIYICNVFLKK